MDTRDTYKQKHVVVLGINHTSSNMELRDRIIFSGTLKEHALEKLANLHNILESVIISTCNRMEIYAVVNDITEGKEALLNFIAEIHSITRSEFELNMYYYSCQKAVKHLYYVVSSLDSMVIGEYQILGQVKNAYRMAMKMGNTSTILNKLFHLAIEAGKRVRSETQIGKGAVSISSVAVELASKILGNLENKSALIVGAGEMSKLTARHLSAAGIKNLYFANRTIERAMEMAGYFNGTYIGLDRLQEIMEFTDIILTSTGAPHYIIEKNDVEKVMKKRKNRAIFLIDIAAPRDINPGVSKIENVFLYSIDNLTVVVKNNTSMREAEAEKVRNVLTEEWQNYFTWYESLKVLPTLISLRNKFEVLCSEELERFSHEISKIPEPGQKLIHKFASSLTKKYLRIPSRVLKEMTIEIDPIILAESVTQLFELNKEVNDKKREL